MYNRYIPNGNTYTRVTEPEREPSRSQPRPPEGGHSPSMPQQRPQESGRQHAPSQSHTRQAPRPQQFQAPSPLGTLLSGLTGTKQSGSGKGILEALKLDDLDSGDILLVLILLFLFRDGDDIELLITLGLILLLGLGDKKDADCQDTAGV